MFDFPNSPIMGETYGIYKWNGQAWIPQGGSGGGGGGGGGTPSDANPLMDGVAAPGVSTDYSRGDHKHPSDTSRALADGGTY